ncbi:MAG: addiction module protein [Acidobacteria bacterium]|jgi:putative addiction module component (TIGR02574 family)|nr:addiction module protein [Acidobacteriota bacterium]
MTQRARELLCDALALPSEERADLAAELIASLDGPAGDPAEVEAAWAAEIERRARRVLDGESAGEPWEETCRRIAGRLPKR